MILYHFHTSPFARRIRLVMALKGISAELRDPRKEDKWWPDLHRLNPLQTVPTLVDGDRVLTDSLSIAWHLEARVPSPSIWPAAKEDMAEVIEIVRLVDGAIDKLVDMGMRFHPVAEATRAKMFPRAQNAMDAVAKTIEARGDAAFLVGDTWTFADIAVVTMGIWFAGLPARAATFAPAKQMIELGYRVPPALEAWTKARLDRPDVATLLP